MNLKSRGFEADIETNGLIAPILHRELDSTTLCHYLGKKFAQLNIIWYCQLVSQMESSRPSDSGMHQNTGMVDG